jgi:tetratricopeptide (TPR) repeat protein
MSRMRFARVALGFAFAGALAGCGASGTRYYVGGFGQNQELKQLFSLLDTESDEKNRFVLIQQIGQTLANAGQREKEVIFLTTWVERHPTDIYNAYYLMMTAEAYQDEGAVPMAIHYYLRILKNHVDLLVGGRSIHLYCLQELISLETRPEYRIEYYKELISRFAGEPDVHLGSAYFFLAQAFDQVGEWDQAIQFYLKYLQSSDTEVAGVTDAYVKAQEYVLFYRSDKSWTVPDLTTLVEAVKDAINTKNVAKMRKCQAKVNFFAKGWGQEYASGVPEGQIGADESGDSTVAAYLLSSNVKVEGSLDVTSNDKEAYLKTTGWNFRPSTWYLYFRKVDFPADPDVNGQWEWAGIYFGENR